MAKARNAPRISEGRTMVRAMDSLAAYLDGKWPKDRTLALLTAIHSSGNLS